MLRLDLSDFDIFKGNAMAMVLEQNVTFANLAEVWIGTEFAVGHTFFEPFRIPVDGQNPFAIEPVFDVIIVDHNL